MINSSFSCFGGDPTKIWCLATPGCLATPPKYVTLLLVMHLGQPQLRRDHVSQLICVSSYPDSLRVLAGHMAACGHAPKTRQMAGGHSGARNAACGQTALSNQIA